MSLCIVYYSLSGITRGVAEKIQAACGGDLIEVRPKQPYTTISAYSRGAKRARSEVHDPIDPETIDVSSYDTIVLGTPVWAFKPTPVINGAIAALKGCEGKRAVIFATSGGMPGETLPILRKFLESREAQVAEEMVINRVDLRSDKKVEELIEKVKSTESKS